MSFTLHFLYFFRPPPTGIAFFKAVDRHIAVKNSKYIKCLRIAAKKGVFFLMAQPLRWRGGGKGLATKKKELFLKLEKTNSPKKCDH